MQIVIRRFHADDIDFALAQTAREGWDPTAGLFETCLAHDPGGCFIAEANGQCVGMVTTTRYRRTAWIGNLIVPPERRKQGIGQRLMVQAMEHLARQGVQTMRLEADPPGVPLYRRLGFVEEFESLRFRWAPSRRRGPVAAERIRPADVPTIASFDTEHFGDDRGRLLELLFGQAWAAYWLAERARIRGYAFVMPSRFGVRIGPGVATDVQAAEALLQSVLADWSDRAVVVGVPAPNGGAVARSQSHGLERAPSCLRMVYGPRVAEGHPENIFAIANGAMG